MTPICEDFSGAFDLPPAPDQELDLTLFDDELDLDVEFGPDPHISDAGEPAAKDSQ